MKKLSIYLLLIIPVVNACDQQKKTDYTGTFELCKFESPRYAGYQKNDNGFDQLTRLEFNIGRELESNELLFQVKTFFLFNKYDTTTSVFRKKQRIDVYTDFDFGLPKYLPFKELSRLKNDDDSVLLTFEKEPESISEYLQQSFWSGVAKVTGNSSYNVKPLTVKLFPTDDNLLKQICGLLELAKSNPNYFVEDRKKLQENQILKRDKKDPIKLLHGPKGFDFSILNNNNLN